MKDLQELIKLISARSQNPLPLLGRREMKPGKETTLYEKIKSGAYKNDEAAAKDLYNCSPSNAKYRMLKNRLEKKLLNQLFFIDFTGNGIKVSHKYEMECLNLLHQTRVLTNTGSRYITEKLLFKAIAMAKEADFTYITISCLELLLMSYSHTTEHKLFYKYKEILVHYRTIYKNEQEAEDIYYTTLLGLRKSVQSKKELLPKLAPILERLKKLWQQSRSFTSFEFYYKLNLYYHELIGNYQEIINITEESNQLFEQQKVNQMRFDHRYNKYMNVSALLRLREYNKGLQQASMYIQAFDRSSNNWFAFMEKYFLLAIHAKEYELAMHLLNTAEKNYFITKITALAHEEWILYSAYLSFAYPKHLRKYASYQAFIAAVPIYSKDKQGFNIAILILQFLYYLEAGEKSSLACLTESLKKYTAYHLDAYSNPRVIIFFQLILLVIKQDFHADICRSKGQHLYEQLLLTPMPGDAYAETEIIPYEHIWEIILAMLDRFTSKTIIHKRVQVR